jgi:hypothetical protein
VLYESLLVFIFVLCLVSLLNTPIWESQIMLWFVRIALYASLNFFELWNCSSASLISFWARCALLFLKKFSHASLRFIWELVILKKFSHASLTLFWEMKIFMLVFFTQICLSLPKAMAIYETSPKVIDIQEGYNKNFHEDHWTK